MSYTSGAAALERRRHGGLGVKADVKPGNAMQLCPQPIGTIVHNIELKAGGKIARSAGAYGQWLGRDSGWAILRLNSGETVRVWGPSA